MHVVDLVFEGLLTQFPAQIASSVAMALATGALRARRRRAHAQRQLAEQKKGITMPSQCLSEPQSGSPTDNTT
ncbi:hypothetical protein ABZ769_30560 [Streptomyces olivoreticuli]